MVLTIDIGNTTIGIGGFQGNKLLFIEKLSSRRPLSDAGYRKKLNMILDKHGLSAEAFEGSVISSVVPSVTAVFPLLWKLFWGRSLCFLPMNWILAMRSVRNFRKRWAATAWQISPEPFPAILCH